MKLSFKKLLLGALLCLLHIVAMAADVFQPGVVLVTYKKDATPEQVAAHKAVIESFRAMNPGMTGGEQSSTDRGAGDGSTPA